MRARLHVWQSKTADTPLSDGIRRTSTRKRKESASKEMVYEEYLKENKIRPSIPPTNIPSTFEEEFASFHRSSAALLYTECRQSRQRDAVTDMYYLRRAGRTGLESTRSATCHRAQVVHHYFPMLSRFACFSAGNVPVRGTYAYIAHAHIRTQTHRQFALLPRQIYSTVYPSKYNRCYEFKGDSIFTIRRLARCGRQYYYNAHIVRVLMPRRAALARVSFSTTYYLLSLPHVKCTATNASALTCPRPSEAPPPRPLRRAPKRERIEEESASRPGQHNQSARKVI